MPPWPYKDEKGKNLPWPDKDEWQISFDNHNIHLMISETQINN